MDDKFHIVKMEGNGFFNVASANSTPVASGKYDVKMPDGTVLENKDVRVEKHPYMYQDHGHTYNAHHKRAYIDLDVYGRNVAINLDGLEISLRKEI